MHLLFRGRLKLLAASLVAVVLLTWLYLLAGNLESEFSRRVAIATTISRVTAWPRPHRWPLPLLGALSGRHAGGAGPGARRPGVAGAPGGGGEPADPSAAQPIAGRHRPGAGR